MTRKAQWEQQASEARRAVERLTYAEKHQSAMIERAREIRSPDPLVTAFVYDAQNLVSVRLWHVRRELKEESFKLACLESLIAHGAVYLWRSERDCDHYSVAYGVRLPSLKRALAYRESALMGAEGPCGVWVISKADYDNRKQNEYARDLAAERAGY